MHAHMSSHFYKMPEKSTQPKWPRISGCLLLSHRGTAGLFTCTTGQALLKEKMPLLKVAVGVHGSH